MLKRINVRIVNPNERTDARVPMTRDYYRIVRASEPDTALASVINLHDLFQRR